jgi:kynureninase
MHNPSSSIPELDLVLGARGFHVSNPPVLQMTLMKASLDVFSQTSIENLCLKSRLLTGYLEMLIEQNLTREAMQRKIDKNGSKDTLRAPWGWNPPPLIWPC